MNPVDNPRYCIYYHKRQIPCEDDSIPGFRCECVDSGVIMHVYTETTEDIRLNEVIGSIELLPGESRYRLKKFFESGRFDN